MREEDIRRHEEKRGLDSSERGTEYTKASAERDLKRALEKAVVEERYEDAARLRDVIEEQCTPEETKEESREY